MYLSYATSTAMSASQSRFQTNASLSDAINPVLEALRLAVLHNFEFLEAIVRLHLAHLHVSGDDLTRPIVKSRFM